MSRLPCLPAPQPPPFFLAKAQAGGGAGVPADAEAADRSHLDDMEGYLQKMTQRGAWQTRYFALNNGYLTYCKDNKNRAVLGALDLSKVRTAAALGRERMRGAPFRATAARLCRVLAAHPLHPPPYAPPSLLPLCGAVH